MAALIHPRKVEAAAPAKGCDLLSHFTIDKLETQNVYHTFPPGFNQA